MKNCRYCKKNIQEQENNQCNKCEHFADLTGNSLSTRDTDYWETLSLIEQKFISEEEFIKLRNKIIDKWEREDNTKKQKEQYEQNIKNRKILDRLLNKY